MSEISDSEWCELVKAGEDAGWKLVWERVIVPETRSMRSADMMRRYSITDGDLMGMLYDEMLGRRKIDLYRGEGSFSGWLRRYVRGFILNANPNRHGEISIDGFAGAEDGVTQKLKPLVVRYSRTIHAARGRCQSLIKKRLVAKAVSEESLHATASVKIPPARAAAMRSA